MNGPDRLTAPATPAVAHADALRVERVETTGALAALRGDWSWLSDRDPQSTFFLAPRWLIPALEARPGRWQLLAARRPDGGLAGLLPLWRMTFRHRETGHLRHELMAAGRMVWSEYCGFLCAPGAEEAVLAAFARDLQRQDWATLTLPYLDQPERAERFARAFPAGGYRATWPAMEINGGAVDSHLCPRLDLPGDAETWMARDLGASTRQKLRRMWRRHIDSGALHLTEATPASINADLDAALALWAGKWAPKPGVVERYRALFRGAMARGLLTMPILRDGERMLGALINLTDAQSGYELFKLAARDETRPEVPTGLLLHGHAITSAIARGLSVYDFGHGDEAYKYRFGARDRRTRTLRITRRG